MRFDSATCLGAADHETEAIFINSSKAFDEVLNGRLLEKLKAHGVGDPLLPRVEEFLVRQTITRSVPQSESRRHPVPSEVPHSSVLNTVVFLLFVDDFPSQLNSPFLL
ncbi:unnamed protein product [Echinostoma caproni]|uniref:Reverse transcriptase domain-containing protein n=1 Tax=Echinostoma caproni TaxID=27848 RepID=A0A183AWN5_9TREM|nr:unnamed protein product [Echinostoma caproni]